MEGCDNWLVGSSRTRVGFQWPLGVQIPHPPPKKENDMNDIGLQIATTEAREACKGKKSLHGRMIAAMKTTKNHWMVTNEDEQLQAAVCATMLESNEDDRKVIEDEWKALRRLSLILSGVGSIADIQTPKKTIGIFKLWKGLKV